MNNFFLLYTQLALVPSFDDRFITNWDQCFKMERTMHEKPSLFLFDYAFLGSIQKGGVVMLHSNYVFPDKDIANFDIN